MRVAVQYGRAHTSTVRVEIVANIARPAVVIFVKPGVAVRAVGAVPLIEARAVASRLFISSDGLRVPATVGSGCTRQKALGVLTFKPNIALSTVFACIVPTRTHRAVGGAPLIGAVAATVWK